ncbi:MAG: FecR family protein [Ignavibacteriales bacterium]|nr:FecR family protein [Ignavibacteriales bacterium]
MKYRMILLLILFVAAQSGNEAFAGYDASKPVATVHKPVGAVEFMATGKDWNRAVPATPLYSGDRVKTGENSFVIIKFIENSILRIQEKSEITIHGDITKNKEFSKNVYMERGSLGFTVQKRTNEKFEFSTPTSVASIRGTEGLLVTGGENADVLIIASGVVVFTNLISRQSVTVGANQAAFSDKQGNMNVKPVTLEQLQQLNNALSGSGTPSDTTGSKTDTTKSGGNRSGGQSSSSGTGSESLSLSFLISTPPVTEGRGFAVSVELTNLSVPLDTVKQLASYFALAYRSEGSQTFEELSATITGNRMKFDIPADKVTGTKIEIYIILRTKTGIEITYPQNNPRSNPLIIPVQSAQRNQLKIEFLDPSGKRRTMVIEY